MLNKFQDYFEGRRWLYFAGEAGKESGEKAEAKPQTDNVDEFFQEEVQKHLTSVSSRFQKAENVFGSKSVLSIGYRALSRLKVPLTVAGAVAASTLSGGALTLPLWAAAGATATYGGLELVRSDAFGISRREKVHAAKLGERLDTLAGEREETEVVNLEKTGMFNWIWGKVSGGKSTVEIGLKKYTGLREAVGNIDAMIAALEKKRAGNLKRKELLKNMRRDFWTTDINLNFISDWASGRNEDHVYQKELAFLQKEKERFEVEIAEMNSQLVQVQAQYAAETSDLNEEIRVDIEYLNSFLDSVGISNEDLLKALEDKGFKLPNPVKIGGVECVTLFNVFGNLINPESGGARDLRRLTFRLQKNIIKRNEIKSRLGLENFEKFNSAKVEEAIARGRKEKYENNMALKEKKEKEKEAARAAAQPAATPVPEASKGEQEAKNLHTSTQAEPIPASEPDKQEAAEQPEPEEGKPGVIRRAAEAVAGAVVGAASTVKEVLVDVVNKPRFSRKEEKILKMVKENKDKEVRLNFSKSFRFLVEELQSKLGLEQKDARLVLAKFKVEYDDFSDRYYLNSEKLRDGRNLVIGLPQKPGERVEILLQKDGVTESGREMDVNFAQMADMEVVPLKDKSEEKIDLDREVVPPADNLSDEEKARINGENKKVIMANMVYWLTVSARGKVKKGELDLNDPAKLAQILRDDKNVIKWVDERIAGGKWKFKNPDLKGKEVVAMIIKNEEGQREFAEMFLAFDPNAKIMKKRGPVVPAGTEVKENVPAAAGELVAETPTDAAQNAEVNQPTVETPAEASNDAGAGADQAGQGENVENAKGNADNQLGQAEGQGAGQPEAVGAGANKSTRELLHEMNSLLEEREAARKAESDAKAWNEFLEMFETGIDQELELKDIDGLILYCGTAQKVESEILKELFEGGLKITKEGEKFVLTSARKNENQIAIEFSDKIGIDEAVLVRDISNAQEPAQAGIQIPVTEFMKHI